VISDSLFLPVDRAIWGCVCLCSMVCGCLCGCLGEWFVLNGGSCGYMHC